MARMSEETKRIVRQIGADKKTAKVLRHMATHKKGITSLDAFDLFHATRLSSIIYNLRNTYGLTITSEDEMTEDGVRYARYKLGEEHVV